MMDSGRQTKEELAALLLLVLSAVAGWLLILQPVSAGIVADRSLLREYRSQLANYRKRNEAYSTVETLQGTPVLAERVYSRDTGGNPVAELQADHQVLARSAGLGASSVRARPEVPGEYFTRVSLQVSATGTIDQLERYLRGATGHQRLLLIDNMIVRAPHRQLDDANPTLEMTWTISGVFRK